MAQRIEARTTPIADTTALNPGAFVASSSTDLLRLVDADFAVLNNDGKPQVIGMLDPYEEVLTIMAYLQSCHFTTVQSSNNIRKDFPGLAHAGLNVIGGLLLIPLKAKTGTHYLVFFRKSQLRQVRWAG
jgi:light-regulated signal transduction histidine kinase (bacteriophytochrome)